MADTLVKIPTRTAIPPITSSNPIGMAIAARSPIMFAKKCSVPAILETLGKPFL